MSFALRAGDIPVGNVRALAYTTEYSFVKSGCSANNISDDADEECGDEEKIVFESLTISIKEQPDGRKAKTILTESHYS